MSKNLFESTVNKTNNTRKPEVYLPTSNHPRGLVTIKTLRPSVTVKSSSA